jgi:subtilisin family serine protease
MKVFKISLFVIGLLCFFTKAIAQIDSTDRNAREVLIFIMPDSLELRPELKRGASLQQSSVKSQQLGATLATTNVISIAKAFPDWIEDDSIAYSRSGERVKRPEFHRVFSLVFDSEQEADEAIKRLSGLSAVIYAEKNAKPTLDNDPQYLNGTQWHLKNDGRNGGVIGADVNAENAWSIFTGSSSITIGIFDSGVEINHDEFLGKASGDQPLPWTPPIPQNSHGTQVSGMAIALANNGLGGRGLDWNAKIRSYRIFDYGQSYIGDVATAAAIVDAVDNQGCQILNNSWSGTIYSATLAQAFAYAYKMDRVSIATMGNTGNMQTRYPGALSNVIAIGSTTNKDVLSPFSTTGNHIDVVAPGGVNTNSTDPENVFTTTTGNNYTFTSGTSFSAPLVSGLASLLKGYNSNLSNDDIRQIIRLSADKVPTMNGVNFSNQYGFGRINAGSALELVRDNQLRQWVATGGTVFSSTGQHSIEFISAIFGLPSQNYTVIRHEVHKTVTFLEYFSQIAGVWGRGVATTGWNMENPNFGEGFCEVVSNTSNSVTLRTYVYEVWNTSNNQYLGYYPSTPANVTFAYTVLGTICTTTNFTVPSVTTDTTVNCKKINVQNVKVQNDAKLTLEADEVTIDGDFEVEDGAELEIW